MKKLLALLLITLPVMAFSQGYTGDYFRARNYVKSPLYLQGSLDTLSTRAYVDLMYDSTFVHTGAFSRCDAYNVTSADTWITLKLDSLCADNTTSGFGFNSDSTGIVCYFNGAVQISGHAKLLNNSAGSVTTSVYFRLRKNGNEISQFNTAVSIAFPANGAHDLVSVTGFVNVNYGDVISVQGRFGNVNIDLQGVDGGIFTRNPAFTIYMCEIRKKDYVYPIIYTTPSISFSPASSTDTVFITSNGNWSASESLTWASLSKSSGSGDDYILVTVLDNAGSSSRTGNILVSQTGITRNTSITQSLIEASPLVSDFNLNGGNRSVSIYSKVSWTLSESITWVTLNKTSGSGNDTFTITASANDTPLPRTGNITLTAGSESIILTVNQEAGLTP